jgi:hypothetical protein
MNDRDAFEWHGGKKGTTQIEDLHAAGVPVRLAPNRGELFLYVAHKSANVLVRPGEWIVPSHLGWDTMNDRPTVSGEPPIMTVSSSDRGEPHPGLVNLHLERVGFRRLGDGGVWLYRYDGLSVIEMNEQGWEAIYRVTSGGVRD